MLSAQEIKATTFNIRYATQNDANNQWAFRKQAVLNFISDEAPDFLGVQEALLSQVEDMAQELGEYVWIGVGRDDGKKGGEFSPVFFLKGKWRLILSKTFWLSETPEIPSKSWDAALPRICTWGKFENLQTGEQIHVFNTHYDHIGVEARENSSHLMTAEIGHITGFEKVILLGDFNSEPESKTIQVLTATPLRDAHEVSEVRIGPTGTFNGFDLIAIPQRRIDYVFCSPDLVPIIYSVDNRVIDGRYLSDHFPVTVVLKQR